MIDEKGRLFNQIEQTLLGGCVERWHTEPGIPSQSVAEHSWGMAQIISYLIGKEIDNPELADMHLDAILWACDHDIDELHTGDIPAPFAWKHPDVKATFIREGNDWRKRNNLRVGHTYATTKPLIEVADRLEAMFYCIRLRRAGNMLTKPIFEKCAVKVQDTLDEDITRDWTERAEELLSDILFTWDKIK